VDLLRKGAPPDSRSSSLGGACLALGRALDAQGRHEEAKVAFQSALENLEITLGPDHPESRAARDRK
jgi:hypothetical protein